VQLVGVFLVFASLIVPALAAKILGLRRPLVFAYGMGVAGYVAGLLASVLVDLPTGAAIVCALAILLAGVLAWAGRTQRPAPPADLTDSGRGLVNDPSPVRTKGKPI
jgi:zinc/manganese transport system permease protein